MSLSRKGFALESSKRVRTSKSPQRPKKALKCASYKDFLSTKIFGSEDLVSLILEYNANELDECARVSRVFLSARNRERFNQTRTGTIIFRTPIDQVPARAWRRWNRHVFTGNRTRLVAILTVGTAERATSYLYHEPEFTLKNVRELVLERDPSVQVPPRRTDDNGIAACQYLTAITTNLDSLDIGSYAKTTQSLGLLNAFGLVGEGVRKFRCEAPDEESRAFAMSQPDFMAFVPDNGIPGRIEGTLNRRKLLEFHVDKFGVYFGDEAPPIAAYCKERHEYDEEEWFENLYWGGPDDYILLQEYPNLERVTLGRATYLERYDQTSAWDYYKTLPQEALIKFVRHTPSLRWFRSDLTPENVAMLKEERPEVHFCSY